MNVRLWPTGLLAVAGSGLALFTLNVTMDGGESVALQASPKEWGDSPRRVVDGGLVYLYSVLLKEEKR